MTKVYNTDDYELNFRTSRGSAKISFYFTVIISLLGLLFLKIFLLSKGNIVDGFSYFLSLDFLLRALIALISIYALILLNRLYIEFLELGPDSISCYRPIDENYFNRIPFFRKEKTVIKLADIVNVWTDILCDQEGVQPVLKGLHTGICTSDYFLIMPTGFKGFFEILDDIDKRCPNADWDQNTLTLIENYRQGISVRETEKQIKNAFKQRFKDLVDSWWKRSKTYSKTLEEHGTFRSRFLMEKLEGKEGYPLLVDTFRTEPYERFGDFLKEGYNWLIKQSLLNSLGMFTFLFILMTIMPRETILSTFLFCFLMSILVVIFLNLVMLPHAYFEYRKNKKKIREEELSRE